MKAYPVAAGRCAHCGRSEPLWTPAAIVAALDKWHETTGKVPSTNAWRKAGRGHPAADQVVEVFGSFETARRAAGLVYVRANDAKGSWTKKSILDAILKWVFLHGRLPRAHEWSTPPEGFPSTKTVRRHFGRWNRAIEQAGYQPTHVRTVAA